MPQNDIFRSFKAYIAAGDLVQARSLFDKIPHPDLRSLTILVTSYAKQGNPKESTKLYYKALRENNIKPDSLLLLSVAKACALSTDLAKAKEVHENAVRLGLDKDLLLGNGMVDMFGKCGFIEGARKVFGRLTDKDVVTWTSLIGAYANCRLPAEGLQAFREMMLFGTRPNSVTLSTVLPTCSELKALNAGREIHCYAVRNGLEDNVFVSSGLMDLYSKCLRMKKARTVFDRMPRKDVVSWSVILAGYFSNGDCEEAMELFNLMKSVGIRMNAASWNCMISGCAQNGRTDHAMQMLARMQRSGLKPDLITIASVLPACADMESVRGCRETHAYIFRHGFIEDMMIATSLLLVYAKCGNLDKSTSIFNRMPHKDTVAWNTMILANSMHGCGAEALSLFYEMIGSGLTPNLVTFTGVLSGCSHSQLVDEGRLIFDSMSKDHGLEPDAEQYASMVDILSRAGHLEEAYQFMQKMPMEPTASAWGSLLGACRVYKNVELGKVAAERLFELEPKNPGSYVQLSNILVGAKLWDDASKIRLLMRERGIAKVPGCSWIQIKNKTYTFVKGDDKNAQRDKIYGFLEEMEERMKLEGYRPDTDFVLQDVDGEQKEDSLCSHSERLAVAFGALNLNGAPVIRVFKNLRICGDCHNAIKFMAKILRVQITVRDSLRFHHFRDGSCSCRDLW